LTFTIDTEDNLILLTEDGQDLYIESYIPNNSNNAMTGLSGITGGGGIDKR
jgi:hypothetical protein